MNTATKVGAYALGLVVVFGAALWIGGRFDTGADNTDQPDEADSGHGQDHSSNGPPATPGGLQISQDGYTLVPASDVMAAGKTTDFQFHIEGPDGKPVTDFTTQHDKDLHLIVVRRDMSQYQHLHPQLGENGTWTVPLDLAEAGDYRAFADFWPTGHDAGLTLGADLSAPGDYAPQELPEPADAATVDEYSVAISGQAVAGQTSELTLTVSKDGKPVTDLEPYLAAYGHLVALRNGDLAYLHVHPDGEPGDGVTEAGPSITFFAEVPSPGAYRLYLDFKHGDTVRTAEFTLDVAPAEGTETDEPAPEDHGESGQNGADEPSPSESHSDDGHGH